MLSVKWLFLEGEPGLVCHRWSEQNNASIVYSVLVKDNIFSSIIAQGIM